MGSGFVRNDDDLRDVLQILSPSARDHLRDVLIRDQADRDAISPRLMRYRDRSGQDWADIIDFLTMHPEARRQVVRVLGELEADHRTTNNPNHHISPRICFFFSSKSSGVMTPASRSSANCFRRAAGSVVGIGTAVGGATGADTSVIRPRTYSATSFARSLMTPLISALFPDAKMISSPVIIPVECCTEEMRPYGKSSKRLLPMPAE
jgi:hypothetical protein